MSDELYRMILHVDVMSLHVGVMRRAICDRNILNLYVLLRAISNCNIQLRSLWRAIFDCDICGLQSSISIFSCDLFFGCGSFGRCLFWTLFRVRTLSFSDFLSDNAGFWCGCLPSDAALLDAVSFGHCFILWTQLVWTLSLSDFILRSDAVSFGLSFGRCRVLMRLLAFRRGSFGRRLFQTMFLWDADSLLRTLLLFLGRRCFCFSKRGCSSSDSSALLRTLMLSLNAAALPRTRILTRESWQTLSVYHDIRI